MSSARDALEAATDALRAAGVDSPRLDAEVLLAAASGATRAEIAASPETPVDPVATRAYAELPRTGLPELFADPADYARYVDVMTRSGAIADATFLWWQLRPSLKYPTLELRVADSCPRLDDGLCIASLYRCLVRRVVRDRTRNAGMTAASRGFIRENLWRAERDGVKAELIDEARAQAVPMTETIEMLLDDTAEDADALGCSEACAHARTIVADGSSADRQLAIFSAARKRGARERDALSAVVDLLAQETAAGPASAVGATRAPSRRR